MSQSGNSGLLTAIRMPYEYLRAGQRMQAEQFFDGLVADAGPYWSPYLGRFRSLLFSADPIPTAPADWIRLGQRAPDAVTAIVCLIEAIVCTSPSPSPDVVDMFLVCMRAVTDTASKMEIQNMLRAVLPQRPSRVFETDAAALRIQRWAEPLRDAVDSWVTPEEQAAYNTSHRDTLMVNESWETDGTPLRRFGAWAITSKGLESRLFQMGWDRLSEPWEQRSEEIPTLAQDRDNLRLALSWARGVLVGPAVASGRPRTEEEWDLGRVHIAIDGTRVRSKGELVIANLLALRGIQYEYEAPLRAPDGSEKSPDFTIVRRGTYYWEHLGMLELASYRDDWNSKLAWYKKHGFATRLITTTEIDGLDTRVVDQILRDHSA